MQHVACESKPTRYTLHAASVVFKEQLLCQRQSHGLYGVHDSTK